MKIIKDKVIYLFVSFIFISIFVFFLHRWYLHKRYLIQRQKRIEILEKLKSELKNEIDRFKQRYAIFIKDLNTGYKIVLNEEKLFPSASLIKIPIMACVYCAEKENKINLNQKVSLKGSDITQGAGILKNAPIGKTFDIEELTRLMITYSDNTATNILIDILGFDYLNKCFKNLGLKDTNISRRILDSKAKAKGYDNYTTARDIGYLLEMFYQKQFIDKHTSERCIEFLKQQKVRDRIPALLPSDIVVAHKTGLENGVCHDVGIIFTKRGDFLICVLTAHNFKTAKPAKQFIAEVAKSLYFAFNKYE